MKQKHRKWDYPKQAGMMKARRRQRKAKAWKLWGDWKKNKIKTNITKTRDRDTDTAVCDTCITDITFNQSDVKKRDKAARPLMVPENILVFFLFSGFKSSAFTGQKTFFVHVKWRTKLKLRPKLKLVKTLFESLLLFIVNAQVFHFNHLFMTHI